MFEGMNTGKTDDNGCMIKCGDRVELFQHKEAYRETTAQDGWGRDIALCRHDQRDIPAREKTIRGTVVYSPKFTSFLVEFDDYMLESGRKDDSLYMLGYAINRKKDRLLVIGK